jgi:hypothetical protein
MIAGDQPRATPYVGPRPYRIGEKLFGRDRERLELLDLLIAERIVLLYSPSGAGKTSLVQAALVPALRNEAFTVPAVARVTFDKAKGVTEPVANRYVFAVLLSLEEAQSKERQLSLAALARMTLPGYLEQRWTVSETLVLILDQFEEALTIDPTDAAAKKELFSQLGAALRNRHHWALFSMREEHVAGLDPYRSLVPTRLNSTFRLEPLNEQQARQAMQETAAQADVVFADGAARRLTDDLRRVRVQRPGGSLEEQLGPTVEPTQLQVVCLRLWSRLPTGKRSIEESDVEALGSADTALADYYSEVVARLGTRERFVRDWIENELITQRGLRNQILKDDALQSHRVDAQAISALDQSYLIREERRRGISWLELAHDRLIEPIRKNNAAWREANLTPFQRQAALWDRQGRPSHLELRGWPLIRAEHWAAGHSAELSCAELNFLQICQRRRRKRIIVSVGVAGLVIFSVGFFELYRTWFVAQPWAHLTDLLDGEPYGLSGDVASIGRADEAPFPVNSQVFLEPTVVSRLHLLVSKDRRAWDMRSLNGTTINAWFLPYANRVNLKQGDLIALAGVALFRFSVAKRSLISFLQPSPPKSSPLAEGAWGMLLDGASRTTIPLTDSDYFLVRGERGNISLANSKIDRSLFRILLSKTGQLELETLYTSDEYRLFAMLKFEDRYYFATAIPSGVRVSEFLKYPSGRSISGAEYASKISFCFRPSFPGRPIRFPGMEMDFVEIGGESSCTLGPFQIIQLRNTNAGASGVGATRDHGAALLQRY